MDSLHLICPFVFNGAAHSVVQTCNTLLKIPNLAAEYFAMENQEF